MEGVTEKPPYHVPKLVSCKSVILVYSYTPRVARVRDLKKLWLGDEHAYTW